MRIAASCTPASSEISAFPTSHITGPRSLRRKFFCRRGLSLDVQLGLCVGLKLIHAALLADIPRVNCQIGCRKTLPHNSKVDPALGKVEVDGDSARCVGALLVCGNRRPERAVKTTLRALLIAIKFGA